jgi:hypothetical protein
MCRAPQMQIGGSRRPVDLLAEDPTRSWTSPMVLGEVLYRLPFTTVRLDDVLARADGRPHQQRGERDRDEGTTVHGRHVNVAARSTDDDA